ncbi:MAG: hypothetical protein Q9191_000664 [Dirinaria sp. TL-2023a]
MSGLPHPGQVLQSNQESPSAPLTGQWNGLRSDKPKDTRVQMQGNVIITKQEGGGGGGGVANTRKTPGRTNSRGRQNSLRRVKNSTEVLRQRSANRGNQDIASDGAAGGREGRQFTVANVGNNGRIYLRPITPGSQQKAALPPFVLPLATPPNSAGLDAKGKTFPTDEARASMWSDTQASRTPTRPKRANSPGRSTQRSSSTPRARSQSLSTAESPLAYQNQGPGAFKVVIDRPKPDHSTTPKPHLPTLEVPIPHYRLGTPGFSARGTAFLHSSVYTGVSANDDERTSVLSGPEYERLFPIPPGMESHSVLSRRHSHSSPQQFSIRITPKNDGQTSSAIMSTPTFHRAEGPITASIYDALSANPDDPTIVRYSPTSGEITAASPARIIAQITSKNFLDYELLSDFFLTVRAYLSTHDLLAYLLARFEWAINRFDDDGRVIRVRAFAALRHWILNYFPYDFVADRDLRVKFCERLNALSKFIRERKNGSSDLKLTLDLKKCWNGRCALYWDIPVSEDDLRRDLDINPGGIAGSRDSQLTHPSELWNRPIDVTPPRIESSVDPAKAACALNNWFDAVLEAGNSAVKSQHERQTSVATAQSLPKSPKSEQSIQAMSCTIPGRALKKYVAHPKDGFAAHPIPIAMVKRVCPAAPSAASNDVERPSKHAHKRSGSFSDAFRDKRASLPSMQARSETSAILSITHTGSLIRGTVVPPGSPYLDTFAPPSPTRETPRLDLPDLDDESCDDPRNPSPLTPAMKNIFGSIRRALSSKQAQALQSSSNFGSGFPSQSMSGAKLSNTPAKGALRLDSNIQQLEAVQKHIRVDLLCADVHEMFQRALQEMSQEDLQPISSIGVASGNERDQPSPDAAQIAGNPEPEPLKRNQSATTYGSRSIVIMDDTGAEHPLPSLPLHFTTSATQAPTLPALEDHSNTSATLVQAPSNLGPGAPALAARTERNEGLGEILDSLPPVIPSARPHEASKRPVGQESSQNSHATFSRPSIPVKSTSRSHVSSQSGSRPIRKYSSFQSGMTGSDFKPWDSPNNLWTAKKDDGPPQGRMLRRRPAGDLRANENVHDLEPTTRPRSASSIATFSDSVRGSELLLKRDTRGNHERRSSTRPPSVLSRRDLSKSDKQLSLVRTHSSQPALRPSFEAAVKEFARIPDDEGGDIEATLMKLEGKYRKSPIDTPQDSSERNPQPKSQPKSQPEPQPKHGQSSSSPNAKCPPEFKHLAQNHAGVATEIPPELEMPSGSDQDSNSRYNMATSLYEESEESYDSTPLLERGLSTRSKGRGKVAPDASKVSVPRPLFSPNLEARSHQSDASLTSVDQVQRGSIRRTRYLSSHTATTDSFLLDEDEFLSDLSSELSEDEKDGDDGTYGSSAQLLQQDRAATPTPGYPSPPMTSENVHKITSQAQQFQDQRKPPTPEPSPVSRKNETSKTNTPDTPKTPITQPLPTMAQNFMTRRHIPFILSYESGVLAEQFTIIEKDAINEINWQDLIDMRWHHSSPSTQNWVDFLRTQDPTGIELVTARFNIMVKWALSEIVLTQSLEERAMCIMKFIHIAQHARKLHNYATMFQFTIALTSIDCSRLTKTWDLIPPAEKKTLSDLETLVTPIRNFHNLRQEMETGNSDDGCIPVVAMYIHDLTYNSQKPSQIASTRDGQPLVNFERYRTTAGIVKSLLRLIDASAKYQFKPVEGAIERCLWMASLSDEMIRVKSKELE